MAEPQGRLGSTHATEHSGCRRGKSESNPARAWPLRTSAGIHLKFKFRVLTLRFKHYATQSYHDDASDRRGEPETPDSVRVESEHQ